MWGREDDYVQLHDLDYRGGANSETLHEARENYVTDGSHAAPPYRPEESASQSSLPATSTTRRSTAAITSVSPTLRSRP